MCLTHTRRYTQCVVLGPGDQFIYMQWKERGLEWGIKQKGKQKKGGKQQGIMEKSQWNKQISRLFPSTDETNLLFRWLSVCVFCLTSVSVVCSIFPEKEIFPLSAPNPCNESGIAITGPLRKQWRQMSRQETSQNHRMEVVHLCGTSRGAVNASRFWGFLGLVSFGGRGFGSAIAIGHSRMSSAYSPIE